MSAQYYYVDPVSQQTRGPVDLEGLQALLGETALDRSTIVCRVVIDAWQPLDAYPEALPSTVAPLPDSLPETTTLPAQRSGPTFIRLVAAAAAVGVLVALAGLAWWKSAPPQRAMPTENKVAIQPPSPPLPTPAPIPLPTAAPTPEIAGSPELTPTPAISPAEGAERGAEIARRMLDQYPKLKVAVVSGISFPKPDGIELYGTGVFGASISFILPEEAWDALSEGEKLDLQAYVAGKVAWVRDHTEDYMIMPRRAAGYEKYMARARGLVDGAWRICSTQSYPDDPDGNLYLKSILAKGPAY